MSQSIKKIQKLGIFMLALFIFMKGGQAQTTSNPSGQPGNAVYNFLTLPYSAKASSMGGINISSLQNDAGLAMYNPSLLENGMDGILHLSIKPYLADIKQYDFSGVNYVAQKNLLVGWGLHYLDYGSIPMTDVAGNQMGSFGPKDYAVQFSVAGNYHQNFHIGATLKFIQSQYGLYNSNGVAMDVGVRYRSTNELSQVSLLVNNIGTQLKSYQNKEELPFYLILGWSKKLENAPFQFSITAEKLSLWNVTYNDTLFNFNEGYKNAASLQNIFNHFIIAGEAYMGKQVSLNVGYNFMRRFDLNIQNQQNWFNGVSTGIGYKLNRMDFQYANAFFQKNMYHHFSVYYHLKKSN